MSLIPIMYDDLPSSEGDESLQRGQDIRHHIFR